MSGATTNLHDPAVQARQERVARGVFAGKTHVLIASVEGVTPDAVVYDLAAVIMDDGWYDLLKSVGSVYFATLRPPHGSYVKIGWACSPWDRIGELQAGCPFPIDLVLALPGSRQDEANYHRRFAAYRHRGGGTEWFRFGGELADFVSLVVRGEVRPWPA